jgi:TolB-like protein/cytochrome c-type biogenesis protein CcmH/NrfG
MKMGASSDVFLFADFRFDRAGGGLFRRDDLGAFAPVTIGSRALDLLAVLIDRRGDVVSKDEIMAAVWPKMAVEEGNLFFQISTLRAILDEEQLGQSCIQTVAGRGYRFIAPVMRCAGLRSTPAEVLEPTRPDGAANRGDAGPPRLSMIVLPFANIGGDPTQDYFVDGVTESLTTDLSRISGAFVIGRSTALTYKGKPVDLKQIGRELNVRYVLEGSVQRGGNRLRVNVQLIEVESGAHLWAERFDKAVADLFDMQDEIVARLANQLQAELIEAEARRAEQAPNPVSMDLYFQGQAIFYRSFSPDMLAKARGFFASAIELDSRNVEALVSLGFVDQAVASFHMSDDPRPLWAAAEAALTKALTLAPSHARAHRYMGHVLCETNRAQRGSEELDRALAIDPNMAQAHGWKALAKVYVGRAGEAEAHVREALRLSPGGPLASHCLAWAGFAKCFLGEHEAAVEWLRKSIDANHNNPLVYFYLAASLAHLGRLDEARREVKAGLADNPKFTLRRFRAGANSDNAVYLAQRERIIEGMRLAGVPEG